MPNPDSCHCSLTGEEGWHQMTVQLSHSATAIDSCRQCHPRGGFTTCAVCFYWTLRKKRCSSSQLGICYSETANRGDTPVHQSFLIKQLKSNVPNLSKCIEKSDFSAGQHTWHGTQKQWRLIRKMKQKEFGPEMDEREWKFPKLSEQAQHYNKSQLLPSLGHYLFIDSMNEVDLLESSTSLFVKSALEDFPCISMNYCCANQSLNKFSPTDGRVQGTLGSLFAGKPCPVSPVTRHGGSSWDLKVVQSCAGWKRQTPLQCLGNWKTIDIVSKRMFS